jgi:hypothetical protein
VVQALAQYGGSRFADAQPRRGQRSGSRFTLALRGYDTARVDELVRRGQAALHSASATERPAVRDEIDSASLPIVTRGYDRTQVDAFLTALSTELASPRTQRALPLCCSPCRNWTPLFRSGLVYKADRLARTGLLLPHRP